MKGLLAWIVMIAMMGLFLSPVVTPGPLEARTFAVNSTADQIDSNPGDGVCQSASGYCALRAAIQEANAFPGPDVIKLKTGLYMLTIAGRSENACLTGDLDINQDLTVIGKGSNSTFINANKLDRVFHIRGEISVKMTDLTIQNGLATENGDGSVITANGGGILNDSTGILTLQRVAISNNTAFTAPVPGEVDVVSGGGLYNLSSKLTIIKSSLFNNAALGGMGLGGAIANHYGPKLTIKETNIYNNIVAARSGGFGGAIFTGGADTSLTIKLSTISNNTVSGPGICVGGGIANESETLTITQSNISDNRVTGGGDDCFGGGFTMFGKVTVTGSTISRNVARGPRAFGGAIRGGSGGIFDPELTVTGTTLSNNAALAEVGEGLGGGVCLEDGTLTVQGASKIVRNFSSDAGGGIFYGGSATGSISGSTVAKNIPDNIYPPQ